MREFLTFLLIVTAMTASAQNDTLFTRTELYHPGD